MGADGIAARGDRFAGLDVPVADFRDRSHPARHLVGDDDVKIGRSVVGGLAELGLQADDGCLFSDALMAFGGEKFKIADAGALIRIEKARAMKWVEGDVCAPPSWKVGRSLKNIEA